MSTRLPKGRIIITCGPSFEPIDKVRRLTNQSTGKLGVVLANRLARSGWEVTCFKAEMATCPDPLVGPERVTFTTNDDLLRKLEGLTYREDVAAFFHVAALCDYKVKQVSDVRGPIIDTAKISSRIGELTLTLEPATKVIGKLRKLFPHSRLIGWKYELNGKREDAIEKGWQQIAQNGTDACVVNGAAYGEGFGVLERAGSGIAHLEDRNVLCEWLAGWLRSKRWTGE